MQTEAAKRTESTLVRDPSVGSRYAEQTSSAAVRPLGLEWLGQAAALTATVMALMARTPTAVGAIESASPQFWQVEVQGRALRLRWSSLELGVSTLPQESVLSAGVPTGMAAIEAVRWLKQATRLSEERLGDLVHATRPTLDTWEQTGGPIRPAKLEHLLAVTDVVRRAAAHYPDLVAWLYTPRGANGRTPAELLKAEDYDQARVLAVTTPSSGVQSAAAWARRPVAPRFAQLAEPRMEPLRPALDDVPALE